MIQAIAIGVIIVALLLLAYRRPALGFGMLGVLIAFALSAYLYTRYVLPENERGITLDKVSLIDLQVITGYANAKLLTGTVANTSTDFPVQTLTIESLLFDCPDANSTAADCREIRRQENTIKLFIPIEEHRALQQTLQYQRRSDTPSEVSRWQHQLIGVE